MEDHSKWLGSSPFIGPQKASQLFPGIWGLTNHVLNGVIFQVVNLPHSKKGIRPPQLSRGIILSHYRDPYKPASIMECQKGLTTAHVHPK